MLRLRPWNRRSAPAPAADPLGFYMAPPEPAKVAPALYRRRWWQVWRPRPPVEDEQLEPRTAAEYQAEARAAPMMLRAFGLKPDFTAVWHPGVVGERHRAQLSYMNQVGWVMPTILTLLAVVGLGGTFVGYYFYMSAIDIGPVSATSRPDPFVEALVLTSFTGGIIVLAAMGDRVRRIWNKCWTRGVVYLYHELPNDRRWIVDEVHLRLLRLAFCDVAGDDDYFSDGGLEDGVIYLEMEIAEGRDLAWLVANPRRIYGLRPARKSWRGSGATRSRDEIDFYARLGERYVARNADPRWDMLKDNWSIIGTIIIWAMIMFWVMIDQPVNLQTVSGQAEATPEATAIPTAAAVEETP